ncbi:MAG: tetratricopeptide repeat protein [Anaerolineae bacterium]|nr:tetratricopeptide repeat protein [Anaerolineae bacterium]
MSSYGKLRRERSALMDGTMFGRRRRGPNPWKIAFFSIAYGAIALVLWQFNNIQPRVLALMGAAPTPTPGSVEYAQRGEAAYLIGDLPTAVTNYRLAAQQDPNNVNIVYELTRTLIYSNFSDVRNFKDGEESLTWSTTLAENRPESARAQAIYCYALVVNDRYEDAVRACLRAVDIDPNLADSYAFLSIAYYELQRYGAALEEAEKAVRIDPANLDGNLAYARALFYAGRSEAALQHFTQAAKVNPALEFPYYELAFLARRMAISSNDDSKFLIALSAYQEVLKRNPNNVKALTRLCQAYLEKSSRSVEDIRDARYYCETATEVDASYSPAYRWLGEVYHRSRNYEDAIDTLGKCMELEQSLPTDRRDPTCWWLRAAGMFVLGDKYCNNQVLSNGTLLPGAVQIAEDVLTWSQDQLTVTEANKVINKCASAYKGTYSTPTPVPTATVPPPPIF